MFTKLNPVWLIARRELRDQMRDWRVVAPMVVLIFCFPILMNGFDKQAVEWLSQYDTTVILERLVPFSILIIGFFPITISLVVALESFVGEKERGTIEPVLCVPLDNWQLYFGKMIIGMVTPLVASCLSILFYLAIVAYQENLLMPPFRILFQLFLLTAAHAALMVSAAIVISVQSTSVKAANLLASFIIVPVAILMQGEAVLLFWGNTQELWLAFGSVLIATALLMRVGVAHFEREYLLGREIDTINVFWISATFWRYFFCGAHSIGEWYKTAVGGVLNKMGLAVFFTLAIAVVSLFMGYGWIMANVAPLIKDASPESLAKLEESAQNMQRVPSLADFQSYVSAPRLFINNTRAVLLIFLGGLFSFGVLGIMFYMLNIGLISGLFTFFGLIGVSSERLGVLFVAGVLPHGIFEIPALMLGSAATLYIAAAIVTPQTGISMGEAILELIADWAKIFFGLVVPMLAIAAIIEAYITPLILVNAFEIAKIMLR